MNMNPSLEKIVRGHILNPLWKSRALRRKKRGEVDGDVTFRYLQRFAPFASGINITADTSTQDKERIFSIWFQGEENAPEIVKACWRSVREHCREELVILDGESVFKWITLPDFIIEKWKAGRIRPAHFADICRLALLKKYGGLWLDATDFIPSEIPAKLWEQDFFVYMSGTTQRGWYSFIQNCFIRARKGNFLVSAWLELVLEYWRKEDRPVDYFVHQLLFKLLISVNARAAGEFALMPKISQDGAHAIWFEHGKDPYDPVLWGQMASDSIFQKTEYKSRAAQNPKPGTNAYHLVHSGMEKPKRLFLFAAYFKNGIIGENLIHYIGSLAANGDVVLCADSNKADSSISLLTPLTLHTEYRKHDEYDFGSYKRCWMWAKENLHIEEYDVVYLVNDSVFGPLKDIESYLEQMERLSSEAFSLVRNPSRKHPHMQSWFVGLKKPVFLSGWFDEFLCSVSPESGKNTVCIKYETGLSELLNEHGIGYKALFSAPHKSIYNSPLKLYRRGLPFIKKSSFTRHGGCLASQIKKILEDSPQNVSESINSEAGRLWGEDYMREFFRCGLLSPALRYARYLLTKAGIIGRRSFS